MHLFILLILLALISCKKNQEREEVQEDDSMQRAENENLQTYAEISIKKDGEWNEREYKGGSFENVSELKVPEDHTDHSGYIRYEGPGWENSQVGYRLYLDWRNAIDIFGKKTDTMVLAQVGKEKLGSYHDEAPWGMDILKAGESLGIGGFGRLMNDTIAHFQKVESTTTRVSNSESSSQVEIEYTGWTTGEETIDLNSTFTIYPEDRYTKVELVPSKSLEGLCTGIVKFGDIDLMQKESDDGSWGYIATYGAQTLVNDEDQLGMAIFYKINEVEETREGPDDHLVIFKPSDERITYYFLAAWEQELNGISSRMEFEADIDEKLKELEGHGELEEIR